VKIRDFFSRL